MIIRIIPFVLYLFLIAMHMVILKDATAVYSATINLPALLVLGVAMYKSELVALWFGFFAGLVMSAGDPHRFGWFALIMSLVALAAYHFRDRLNLESIYSKLVFVFCGVLILNTAILLIEGARDFLYLFFVNGLTGAVYTTIGGWVFFLFKEKRITFQKFRELF